MSGSVLRETADDRCAKARSGPAKPRPALWCGLHFPALALDLLRQTVEDPCQPLAVVDDARSRPRIHLANRSARAAGVLPGRSLAAARARCPELWTRPRDPAAEWRALEHLASVCHAWSQRVCLPPRLPVGQPPKAELLVELGASQRLFGPAAEIQQAMQRSLAGLGYTVRSACAPTPRAALLLARARYGGIVSEPSGLAAALAPIPLALTELPEQARAALEGSGLHRLGQVLRLPRPELGRRIGAIALAWLDALEGRRGESPPVWQPPPRFEQGLELPAEIEQVQGLVFPLQRLLQLLEAFLRGRDAAVQQLTICLEHARGKPSRIELGLLEPQRDARLLLGLCRSRIERMALAAPVRCIHLLGGPLLEFTSQPRPLFAEVEGDDQGRAPLLELLRARLGEAALDTPGSQADHRPECSWTLHPPGRAASAVARPLRPAWLLETPEPVDPATLELLSGPERIESGWWDGSDCRRDYYLARDARGACCWVFHQQGPRPRWFIHGWFG